LQNDRITAGNLVDYVKDTPKKGKNFEWENVDKQGLLPDKQLYFTNFS